MRLISNAAFAALSAFLMVFFAQFMLAPSWIAKAWGVVLVVFCAASMVYFANEK